MRFDKAIYFIAFIYVYATIPCSKCYAQVYDDLPIKIETFEKPIAEIGVSEALPRYTAFSRNDIGKNKIKSIRKIEINEAVKKVRETLLFDKCGFITKQTERTDSETIYNIQYAYSHNKRQVTRTVLVNGVKALYQVYFYNNRLAIDSSIKIGYDKNRPFDDSVSYSVKYDSNNRVLTSTITTFFPYARKNIEQYEYGIDTSYSIHNFFPPLKLLNIIDVDTIYNEWRIKLLPRKHYYVEAVVANNVIENEKRYFVCADSFTLYWARRYGHATAGFETKELIVYDKDRIIKHRYCIHIESDDFTGNTHGRTLTFYGMEMLHYYNKHATYAYIPEYHNIVSSLSLRRIVYNDEMQIDHIESEELSGNNITNIQTVGRREILCPIKYLYDTYH